MTKTINLNDLVMKFEEAAYSGKIGYNMYDVVPMDISSLNKVINPDEVIEAEIIEVNESSDAFTFLKNKINTFNEEANELSREINFGRTPGFDEFVERIVETYNVTREEVIREYGDLPVSGLKKIKKVNPHTYIEEDDVLTKASLAPRASLNILKDVTEKLGFMITPWEHHNQRSFETESIETQKAIKEFEGLEEYFDLYVISPLIYWDIEAIVKAEDPNKWSYVSSKISEIVNAIRIQLPTLRNFHQRISNLEDRTDDLESDSRIYKQSIQEIYSELDRIQSEIEKINKKITQQDRELQEAQRAAAAALREAATARDEAAASRSLAMQAIDPLLFAVPKGHNMEEDCKCVVGPVWGPDFNWLLLAKERMDVNLNQRPLIEKINPFLIQG